MAQCEGGKLSGVACSSETNMCVPMGEGKEALWLCQPCLGSITGGFCRVHYVAHVLLPGGVRRGCPRCPASEMTVDVSARFEEAHGGWYPNK